jgi:(1->4)-alpha-D-glucan 1-alpha-D-glucosylmutase
MLGALEAAEPRDLLQNWPDGRIKMFVTQRLLRFRREHPQLFLSGSYIPLRTSGTHAESCVAYAREQEGKWIVILAPRLTARVGFPPIGDAWQDTAVELPEAAASADAADLFTDRKLHMDGSVLKLSEAMATLPFCAYRSAK